MNACSLSVLARIAAVLCLIYRGAGGASHPRYRLDLILCNGESFASGDPYGRSVYEVLNDLVETTPNRPGKVYQTEYFNEGSSSIAYGYAGCTNELPSSDCHLCLVASLANLLGGCPMRRGGQVVFADCTLRYEPYRFNP